jgi:peptidyl-prolyl cis-trans isomerase SurA
MKYKLSICGLLLLSLAAANAQVASHAPTVFTPAPAPSSASGSAAASATVTLTPTGKPVARVNGTVLTDTDLVREEYAIFPYARQHNGIPKELETQIRGGALKMIVFEELVYQEAQRRKMTISAARLQRAEEDYRKQFATPEEFHELIQSEFHGSEQSLQDKIRRSLLIEAFLKIEVDSKSAVSPAELKTYYDKNSTLFEHPESFIFQTISVLPPANATAEQLKEGRARAEKELREAKATKTAEEFGLLAEKISDDDYRVMMGQHKSTPASQLAPQVVTALRAMKPDEVSDLLQLDQAYTIVRLNEHTPAGKSTFQDVKAKLEKELPQTKKNQLRAALDKKLRQNAKVEEM